MGGGGERGWGIFQKQLEKRGKDEGGLEGPSRKKEMTQVQGCVLQKTSCLH